MRRTLLAAALLFCAQSLFAGDPSTRTGARMTFDESKGLTVLFGGVTPSDLGTVQPYYPADTWLWTGVQWLQRYTAHTPTGRASHAMVYDPNRQRIVIFGGRNGNDDLNDTWVFENGDWTQVATPDAPQARALPGAAFDRNRDRVVLFGGNHTVVATNGVATTTNFYDTWEFDGTTWTKVSDSGPQVISPQLVFDEAHNGGQTLLVGENDKLEPQMYSYDPASHSWTLLAPANLPPCVNQSGLAFQRSTGTVLLVGGACVTSTFSSPSTEEAYSYDGTTWTKVDTKTSIFRVTNQAIAYDAAHDRVVIYGGTEAYGSPRSTTYVFDPTVVDPDNTPPKFTADWVPQSSNLTMPGPRSLAAMRTDPVNKIVYMLNGLTDSSYFSDFWKYQNGGWQRIVAENTPSCGTPFAAFDTDRSVLVAVCNDGSTSEWDGTAWKTFADLKTKPPYRRFAAMTYDATLKKSVLYGGYDDTNYLNTTWLWDGTTWTEQKKNRAPARGLTTIWFDPILHKTVIYGGLGRPNPEDRLQRYNDMWSLDGNGWTPIKPSTLPTTRYGAQVAVDPRTNHAILFGGLRLDVDSKGLQKQVYANDMWEWDGANWKQLTIANAPPPRENASLEFDYSRNGLVLFGGWAGYYLSDTWLFEGDTWRVITQTLERRRVSRP